MLAACQHEAQEQTALQAFPDTVLRLVTATAQTEPVSANPNDDAADDPAIWIHPTDPDKSLILGSDKTLGLDVFDLNGTRLMTDTVGRINNVDVRNGFSYQGAQIALAGGSNRDNIGMDFWRIDGENGSVHLLTPGSIKSDLPDVYGFCLYTSALDNATYAFVNSKTGKVEQWRLDGNTDSLSAVKMRELQLPSQVEGMVADDHHGTLFVGVEGAGVFYFGAEPNDNTEGVRIPLTGEDNPAIKYDVEGLALYQSSNAEGYLLLSSQGNNTYAVFDRTNAYDYLGSFKVIDGSIDGTQETDGIDVTSVATTFYPKGFLVVQDGENFENGVKQAQNFKIIRWDEIAQKMNPPLKH